MRRVGSWGVAAALIVGLGLAAAGAQEQDGDSKAAPAKSGSWFGWLGDKSKSKAKPKAKAEKTSTEDRPAPPSAAELAVVEQKRQMNAYLRRVEVCLRLRQVAEETGNADLQRQAEEMDARAWEIYQQQTAQLPVPTESPDSGIKAPSKKSKPGGGRSVDARDDEPAPAAKRASKTSHSADHMDGDFEQRERSLINDTFMGRDKP